MKTLIELFDVAQIENAIAGLRFKPEKIVYVGFSEIMTPKKKRNLVQFFEAREENIQIDFEIVGRYDYANICERLNYILDTNEDCCFDLTGGKELVLTAMGEVSALRNVPMVQFNVRDGKYTPVKNCNDIEETEQVGISLDECMSLNGCLINHKDPDDFEWDFTEEFKKDIETMWRINCHHCRTWNKQSVIFERIDEFAKPDYGMNVKIDWSVYRKRYDHDRLNDYVIQQLQEAGMIRDYSFDGDILTFGYKNNQVYKCLTKAGSILELYSYIILREIAEEMPGYYNDIDIGVFVDWDGVIHDSLSNTKDVKNELDIMVMRGLVPIFISCKNGEVVKESFYELSSLAQRFGGKYAKKIMLSTYVHQYDDNVKYLKQRANDMGITVVNDLHKKTRDEFKAILRKYIC